MNEIDKLSNLITYKSEKKVPALKEIALLRKECKQLEKDCEEYKQTQENVTLEIQNEKSLSETLSQIVMNLKKQLNETRKDKEKLLGMVKQDYKVLDNLAKRKEIIDEDSTKLVLDF